MYFNVNSLGGKYRKNSHNVSSLRLLKRYDIQQLSKTLRRYPEDK